MDEGDVPWIKTRAESTDFPARECMIKRITAKNWPPVRASSLE